MQNHRRSITGTSIASAVLIATFAVGCGGDSDITVGDLEGSWQASSVAITANDDPTAAMDLIAVGGTLLLETDESGRTEASLTLPAAAGGPADLTAIGQFELIDQETLGVDWEQEIPPMLIDYSGSFTLDGDTLTVTDENSMFDFGSGVVPSTNAAVFERGS